jgi:alpha-L-fucosidase
MKHRLTCLLLLASVVCQAQRFTPYTGNNYVTLSTGEDEAGIIRAAAGVTPSPRQLRWQELELTAFFHFGINTFTGNEWGNGKEDPALFNPTDLNVRQWVRVCKEAGIKQVILTAKHHDGFCLWPSKYTEHSVKNSPWKGGKGDVVKEVSDAAREYGMGFGIYLSPWDRNSPYYGDSAKYNQYFLNQLTELLTGYGRIDEVWFDGANGEGPNGKKQVYDFDAWYALIRRLQPQAVIAVMGPDVRWVGTESGYGRETEWSVLPVDARTQENIQAHSQKDATFKPQGDMTGEDLGGRDKLMGARGLVWYPSETDVSIRPGWFYHAAQDSQVKTASKLMDIYLHSVGRNSLLLLNIPPDRRGLISDSDVVHLKAWGKLRQAAFEHNLLLKGTLSGAGVGGETMAHLTDGDGATGWMAPAADTTAVLEADFTFKKTFNVLSLQENIRIGQRIERFRLEYWDDFGMAWKEAAEGTTVGYKRLLTFNRITTKKVRLTIGSSRLNPTLSQWGLYDAIIP